MVCKVRREVLKEFHSGFSLGLRDAHNVKANEAEELSCYADVVTLMRRVEIEVSEGRSSVLLQDNKGMYLIEERPINRKSYSA
jgi:hypothetical protein